MKPQVLVLEDDPLIALDVGYWLEDEGAEPILTHALASALEAADRPLSFALLDVNVPDGHSFELPRKLTARGVVLAFVCGAIADQIPADLRNAPFVGKPWSEALLRAAMTPHLNFAA